MAVFTITGNVGAFNDGTADPDALIVKKHASIVSSDLAAALLEPGAWTVKVDGLVLSTGQAFTSVGMFIPLSLGATSKITVGKSGKIDGHDGLVANSSVSVTNHGTISGDRFAIALSNESDTLVNTGKIVATDELRLYDGNDLLINSGRIFGTSVLGGIGEDTVINFQKLGHTIKSGTILGTIDLGEGNDTFKGGNKAEIVQDGSGGDNYSLGGGKDTYRAVASGGSDGQDAVNGGKGIDTYDASNAAATVHLNLDNFGHFTLPALEALQAADNSVDKLTGFENAIGGAAVDWFIGSKGVNKFDGGGGNDTLMGLGGADILTGGAGGDSFHYVLRSDSGVTAKTRDVITDFEQGIDAIGFNNLQDTLGGRSFTFIGQQKFHHDGDAEFRFSFTGGNTLVSLDVNGNGKADMSILLNGHYSLTSGDFFFY